MTHGRQNLGQRVLDGVDLAIDLATLGEYGLEPLSADGRCRERAGAPPRPSGAAAREALAAARRGACGHSRPWAFPSAAGRRRVDFRAAVARYAA